MKSKKLEVGCELISNKKIIAEVTYDFFANNLGWEWALGYNGNIINIAWHIFKKRAIYEFNINGHDEKNAIRLEFDSPELLLEGATIEGKSLKEIWDDIEVL